MADPHPEGFEPRSFEIGISKTEKHATRPHTRDVACVYVTVSLSVSKSRDSRVRGPRRPFQTRMGGGVSVGMVSNANMYLSSRRLLSRAG